MSRNAMLYSISDTDIIWLNADFSIKTFLFSTYTTGCSTQDLFIVLRVLALHSKFLDHLISFSKFFILDISSLSSFWIRLRIWKIIQCMISRRLWLLLSAFVFHRLRSGIMLDKYEIGKNPCEKVWERNILIIVLVQSPEYGLDISFLNRVPREVLYDKLDMLFRNFAFAFRV